MEGGTLSRQAGVRTPFRQWFSPRRCCPGDIWQYREAFWVVIAKAENANGAWRVEARDAAKCPTVHRTAPTTENHLIPDVRRAEAEHHGLT